MKDLKERTEEIKNFRDLAINARTGVEYLIALQKKDNEKLDQLLKLKKHKRIKYWWIFNRTKIRFKRLVEMCTVYEQYNDMWMSLLDDLQEKLYKTGDLK